MSHLERYTYHCLRCGRLVCRDRHLDDPEEQELPPPTCCGGLPMVRAVCESVRADESASRKDVVGTHPTATSGAVMPDAGTTPTGTVP
jgi:hypothetical protein